ncbi:MAG: HlyD family secretion protein [Caulobacterales bacterium]
MALIPMNRILPLLGGTAAVIAVAVGGGFWWADKQHYETTDNAFVEADTVQVSPQVSGTVAEVLVADNQSVSPGQVLVKLDPSTYQARLDQAVANAAALDAGVKNVDDHAALEQAMIAQKAAGIASARASAEMAKSDMDRYATLAKTGWVSTQQVQTQKSTTDQTAAAVAQAQAALLAEQKTASALGSTRLQSAAQAAGARAAVEQARLDLDHTVIRSPATGVVGARAVRAGQLVQPGQALMAVVPLGRAYVVANFKETQVARLRIGQVVEIRADAFGRAPIRGRVESFAPATGQEFALIPVENAVGNFTKITQRVPVKIVLDDRSPMAGALRPGLSVEVKVDVTDRSGPSFADSAGAGSQFARRGEDR